MKAVEVRNIKIGEGIPKICVPIVGVTKEDIINEAKTFDNIPVDDGGRMCHNFPAICKEIDAALSKINSADGLSFDTWGVDYGLLNKSGNLLRLPCHYRDTRTAGTVEKVLKKIYLT